MANKKIDDEPQDPHAGWQTAESVTPQDPSDYYAEPAGPSGDTPLLRGTRLYIEERPQ